MHPKHIRQGVDSLTFHPPPLDFSLTIPELYEYNAQHSPQHPYLVYTDDQGQLKEVCYPEALHAIRSAAGIMEVHYKRCAQRYAEQKREENQPPVIAVLATSDTLSYLFLLHGIMRLGLTPFPISTRNSAAGVASLLSRTGALQMVVSSDPAMQRLYTEAIRILSEDGVDIDLVPMPRYSEFASEGQYESAGKVKKLRADETAMILHSSGSTAFPKPIRISSRAYFNWTLLPYYGERDLCGKRIGMHSVPMFHAMGSTALTFGVCSGVIVAMFKSTLPPMMPTVDNILGAIVSDRCDILFCVPSIVENCARDPASLQILSKLDAIIYAGAPMNPVVGDKLANAGVALFSTWGSTETSGCVMFIPEKRQPAGEWGYFTLAPHIDMRMLPQEGQHDLFEPVLVANDWYFPNVSNMTIDGRPAYAMGDLLQRHPQDPTRWRVYGRIDEQIMLSTGEKTNPVPLEEILLQDKHIAAAIMFGRGRAQNGVLIHPEEAFVFSPQDEKRLEEFRNLIWPTVERVNKYAPAHSRLFKEMIIVTDPAKPLEYTTKGTPRRPTSLALYGDEIEAVYNAVSKVSQTDLLSPTEWDLESTLEFVRTAVERVMTVSIDDDNDLFQNGCDSLQATWIRNTIIHALRSSTSLPAHSIPYSFVYDNPTVQTMSQFIVGLVSGTLGLDTEAGKEAKVLSMKALVKKYASSFRRRPGEVVASTPGGADDARVVLLTGSTGRLGSHILSQLAGRHDVRKVYALNRTSAGASFNSSPLVERQKAAFKAWGLDDNVLSSDKVVLLGGEASQIELGLESNIYRELRDSVTVIIHNAWRVDFNVALTSFEPLLGGVRNLIELSLGSTRAAPPHIIFTSSISVLRNHTADTPAMEVALHDPHIAIGGGYSESKWIAEQLLEEAARLASIPTTTVRIGQLSGDKSIGGWTEKEWVPAMLKLSQLVGALPLRDETLSWIAVDTAASALLDMLDTTEPVLHIVHPRPVPWSTFTLAASTLLNIPVVPYVEWVERLRGLQDDAPGFKPTSAMALRPFFESFDLATDAELSTDKAVAVSNVLREATPMSADDVSKWVSYLRSVSFLDI